MISCKIDGLDIELPSSGISVLFGPTGVGKSTLLRKLCGHVPFKGEHIFNDQIIANSKTTIAVEKRNFGYLSQHNTLVVSLTVKQNLQIAVDFSSEYVADEYYQQIISMCSLDKLLGRNCRNLSGGETQLVSFACMLLLRPKWLLLDEPFSALDMSLKHRLLNKFKAWLEEHETPVLYVSHDVNEVALIADNIVILNKASKAVVQSYDDLIKDVDSEFVTQNLLLNTLVAEPILVGEELLQLGLIDSEIERLIWVQANDVEISSKLMIEVPVADISISLSPLERSSILNQLQGIVEVIGEEVLGYQYLSIALGTQSVTARLTKKSVGDLDLQVGKGCYVCFKTPRLRA